MSTKSILTYSLLTIGLLLLFKIYYDRNSSSAPPVTESPTEAKEIKISEFPVSYCLGTFDPRFGISQERFLQIAEQAKQVWEYAADKDLFKYQQDATFKINLIFDWRQERLLEAKERKAKIDEGGKSFDLLRTEHEEISSSVEALRLPYAESAQAYKSHLDDYNSRVARWNEGANRTDSEFRYLQNRKPELDEEGNAVEKKWVELSTKMEKLNRLGERINALASEYNLEVENFNGMLIETREFEKGIYDGKAINLYEFDKEDDLKITLVHEFGHALGLQHIENPKAIMHRRLGAQDLDDIRLTSDDLKLLSDKFR